MKITMTLSVLLVIILGTVMGCSAMLEQAPGLIGIIVNSFGLDQNQAIASVGSILGLASEKLGSQDYEKIASAIPGSTDLIKQARELTGVGNKFGTLAKVTSALGKMGVMPDQITKIGNAMADFGGATGGESVKGLLLGVLK